MVWAPFDGHVGGDSLLCALREVAFEMLIPVAVLVAPMLEQENTGSIPAVLWLQP